MIRRVRHRHRVRQRVSQPALAMPAPQEQPWVEDRVGRRAGLGSYPGHQERQADGYGEVDGYAAAERRCLRVLSP